MITREAKEKMIVDITDDLINSDFIVVTNYRGLKVQSINELRRRLREKNCLFRITKNTMNRLACKKAELEELENYFEGPTAIAYSSSDPVVVAKIISDFAKESEVLEIKGGMLSGDLLAPEELKALGEIPPKEVLLAKLVGGLQSPIYGLHGALSGNLRKLVYALDAVKQKKESA